MKFDLFKKTKQEEEGVKKGERFAVPYSYITTCIYKEKENPNTYATITYDAHYLDMKDIKDLWTVVEYIGDGQYLDLISGQIFTNQMLDTDIPETYTREDQEEAFEMKKRLLKSPLSISSNGNLTHSILKPLTLNMKKKIVDESMPRQEEIKRIMAEKEAEARAKVGIFYAKREKKNLKMLANITKKELVEKEAREEREAEERRIAEEKQLKEELLRRDVEPRFNKMFPTHPLSTIKTKILKK